MTLERAKQEVDRLQEFIDLVEDVSTLEQWIVKEYELTNSIAKIVKLAIEQDVCNNSEPLDRKYITKVISGRIIDDLHRILRSSGYRQKIKPHKGKYSSFLSERWKK